MLIDLPPAHRRCPFYGLSNVDESFWVNWFSLVGLPFHCTFNRREMASRTFEFLSLLFLFQLWHFGKWICTWRIRTTWEASKYTCSLRWNPNRLLSSIWASSICWSLLLVSRIIYGRIKVCQLWGLTECVLAKCVVSTVKGGTSGCAQ